MCYEPGRRSAAKLLSKDEARRIAANIAKLQLCCRARSCASIYRRDVVRKIALDRPTVCRDYAARPFILRKARVPSLERSVPTRKSKYLFRR
jgi:hypothetical protein